MTKKQKLLHLILSSVAIVYFTFIFYSSAEAANFAVNLNVGGEGWSYCF